MDSVGDNRLPAEADAVEDDRLIRELLQNWVVWRDAGHWERFRHGLASRTAACTATWTQGTCGRVHQAISQAGWAKGVSILHFLGGISIDLAGPRAVAQTKMTISQRAAGGGRAVRRALHRALLRLPREARTDAGASCCASRSTRRTASTRSAPGAGPVLDPALLARFPEGYRHLAYLQTRIGYAVKRDMPGLDGPEVEALYARGAAWLRGEAP